MREVTPGGNPLHGLKAESLYPHLYPSYPLYPLDRFGSLVSVGTLVVQTWQIERSLLGVVVAVVMMTMMTMMMMMPMIITSDGFIRW